MDTLKFLLESKQADASKTGEVVNEAVEWMQGQLQNAGIAFQYVPAGAGAGSYGVLQVRPLNPEVHLLLEMRVAEIKASPHVSAVVRQTDGGSVCFPYYGEMGSEDGRATLLNFVADFVLSTSNKLG